MAATRQQLLDGRKRPAPAQAVPVEELVLPELPPSTVTCKQEWVELSPEAEPEPARAPSGCWPWPAAAAQQQPPQVQVHRQSVVRVVHVYAPKVIHTEPHNFRALVHQLTGHTPAPAAAAPGAAAGDVNGTARVRPAAKRAKLEKQVVQQVATPTASDGAGGAAQLEDDDRSRYRQSQQTLVAGGGAGGGGGLQYPRPELHQALARYRYRPGPAASAQHAHSCRRSLPTLQQLYPGTSAHHIPARRLDMPSDAPAPVPIAAAAGATTTSLDQQLQHLATSSVPAAPLSAGVVTLAYPAAAAAVTPVTSSSNSTPTSSPGPPGLVPRPAPTPAPPPPGPPYSYCNSHAYSYDDVSSHNAGHQHHVHHKRLQLRMLQRQDSFTSSANSGPTSAAGTMTYLHHHGQLPEAAEYPAGCDDTMPLTSTTSYQPPPQQQRHHHHHLAEHQSQQEALGHLFALPGPGPGHYYTSSASTAGAGAGLQQQPDYTWSSSGRSDVDSGLQMAMGINIGGGFQHHHTQQQQQQLHAGSLYGLLTASGSTSSSRAACVPTATVEQPPGPGADPDALSDTELFLEMWGGGSAASLHHHLHTPSTQQLCTAFTMPVGAPEQHQQQRQPS